ncbi:phage virion morphogenesis protein [Marinobacter subterrani]|uniref:Phage virion morphogenesis (Putative tail completion) protein n=1 Tax=Marinobacter subterrani TaxID=1658765 RepID=A0A0J7J491_9GAMM|nr:phage virion morphogenesis protein [Marinobacter subterrani]KMQ72814.1 phage virion morphogenesis (putative tail completion) protein [Marinobacter subterrani]KMQ75335.1 phage virion morphogenesis (putative tail completion) protein [Marinobacter subterrani]
MAGVNLQWRIETERLERALQALADRGGNARPAFEAIGEDLLLSHRDRFDAQESPEGEPWEPLSEAYRKRKKRRKDEILVLNTYLRDTQRYRADADQLEYGSDRVYAATHQFGDDERGIPARPWLGLSPDDERAAVQTLLDFMGHPLGLN